MDHAVLGKKTVEKTNYPVVVSNITPASSSWW